MTDSELTSRDFIHSIHSTDPFLLFKQWLEDANQAEINDPNAMSLATVDDDGMPNIRIVLLKDFTRKGFTFYTNFESTKGQEILSSGKIALCFHWKSLRRQIRVRGTALPVSDTEADDYFKSRPYGSRIGAWSSKQSRPLSGRAELEDAVKHFEKKFENSEIPRPEYWSGFLLTPQSIEFWHDQPYRLHDRILFTRTNDSNETDFSDWINSTNWNSVFLYP